MLTPIEIGLIVLVCIAAWSDLRTRHIPNSITVSGAVVALLLHAFYGGIGGAMQSLTGAVLGLAIFFAFYACGGMGAGDVKLFGAVGAFAGPHALVLIFVFTGLLGGIAAVALALWHGRLGHTLARTAQLAAGMRASATAPDALRLPYGAVIAGGTLVSLLVLKV